MGLASNRLRDTGTRIPLIRTGSMSQARARRQRTTVIANPTDVTAKPMAKLAVATASSAVRLPCTAQARMLYANMRRNATQSAACITKRLLWGRDALPDGCLCRRQVRPHASPAATGISSVNIAQQTASELGEPADGELSRIAEIDWASVIDGAGEGPP